ncbi:MAG: carbohydrate kinase family protein [Firmicutes bacterium]|nr:carbohydrate kinase family protein [Bacillota bacterium]
MKQTLVIGSTVVDVIVEIPHLPITGEDVHIKKQSRSLGGCAFLVSDILRHFQAANSLCTAVGGGIYGDYVRKHLEQRGVPIYVSRPQRENGCCYCMVEDGGERTFIVDHGVEYTFEEDYLKTIDTDRIDSVYVCGLEVEETTGMNIIAYLEKHRQYTIYFAPGARILKIQPERMERMLALHPILHMNEEESLTYTREETVERAARALYQKTGRPVIITLGKRGAYSFDGQRDLYADPVPAQVCDTIGAGDSHIGTVIAARRFGLSLEDAVRMGNHISAAVVGNRGGMLSPEDFCRAVEALPTDLKNKLAYGKSAAADRREMQ